MSAITVVPTEAYLSKLISAARRKIKKLGTGTRLKTLVYVIGPAP